MKVQSLHTNSKESLVAEILKGNLVFEFDRKWYAIEEVVGLSSVDETTLLHDFEIVHRAVEACASRLPNGMYYTNRLGMIDTTVIFGVHLRNTVVSFCSSRTHAPGFTFKLKTVDCGGL